MIRFVFALLLIAFPAAAEAPKSEAAFLRENDKAMAAMMAGMEVKPSGDVDRDFARMMIPHHQGAVDMAKALLKYGKNPELLKLARTIIVTQQQEIALMRRVLGETGPAPKAGPVPPGHMHHGM